MIIFYFICLNYMNFIFSNKINNYIEFIFDSNHNSDFNIMNYLYINFSISQQIIPINLTFQYYGTFISGSNTSYNSYFDEKKSLSYKNNLEKQLNFYDFNGRTDSYHFIFNNGYNSSDILNLNKKTKFTFNFLLVSSFKNKNEEHNYLGLKLNPEKYEIKNFESYDLLKQLKNKNIISNYFISFAFENEKSSKGKIYFGIPMHEIFPNKFNIINLHKMKSESYKGKLDWRLKFTSIIYDNFNNENTEYMLQFARISLEDNYIYCKPDFWKNLKIFFFIDLIDKNICFEDNINNNIKYFYCNLNLDITTFKNVSFYIKEENFSFIFTYKDLFIKKNDKYYFLILFNIHSEEWIFVIKFLKKYPLMFNYDYKMIYWYDNNNIIKNDTKYVYIYSINLFFILFIILLILVIIYLLTIIPRKKKIYEIQDDYEYIYYKNNKEIELKKENNI